MFGAIGRWFKSLGYLLTGQMDAARGSLDAHPSSVRARYDQIVKEKVEQIQQYKKAVAALIAQQENKMAKLKEWTGEVEKLERLKAGALAKAKQSVAALQAEGKSKEEIHADDNYRKCLSAFNDFDSSLTEKQGRIEDAETDVGELGKNIADHKLQLRQLLRDVEKIKEEAAEAVADVISSKQERDIADMLTGISDDKASEELNRLRKLRQELKAEARISKELSGTDSRAQEAEFLEYARTSQAGNEFDELIGLAEKVEKKNAAAREDERPESESRLPE